MVPFALTHHPHRGTTILETVVYIALVVAIAVSLIDSVASMMVAFNKSRAKRTATVNANVVLERMVREVRLASAVNSGASTLNTTVNPALALDTITSASNPTVTTRRFALLNGVVTLAEPIGGAAVPLTSGVTVTSLLFRSTSTLVSTAIRIEMTVQSGAGKQQSTYTYSASALLRGAY